MKRDAILLAALVALVLAALGGYVLYRSHGQGNVRGSSSVEFVAPAPAPATQRPRTTDAVAWPTYGFDNQRRRSLENTDVAPPFTILWTFHAHSLIEFPPAIAYGRLFFANNDGVFFALAAQTGRALWQSNLRRCVAASPAVEGSLVYMTFLNHPPCNAASATDGLIVAFRSSTGAIAWQRTIGPSESSPLLAGGRVYVGDWRGDISAFDAQTGHSVWRFHTGGRIKGALALAGGRLYVGAYDGNLYALDAHSGTLLWKAGAQGTLLGGGAFYATPAVAYGRVYIGATDSRVYSFGAQSGKLRWSYGTGGYVYSSAAVWRGLVLVGSYSGNFYALDAATGAQRWRFTANGPISGSPSVVHGIVYFATLHERSYGLDARNGRELWTFPDGKYSPVTADRRHVYLVGYARVFALRPQNASR